MLLWNCHKYRRKLGASSTVEWMLMKSFSFSKTYLNPSFFFLKQTILRQQVVTSRRNYDLYFKRCISLTKRVFVDFHLPPSPPPNFLYMGTLCSGLQFLPSLYASSVSLQVDVMRARRCLKVQEHWRKRGGAESKFYPLRG